MPELNGKVNVNAWPDFGNEPWRGPDSVIVVEVTSTTLVPGETNEDEGIGASVIPTAIPSVPFSAKVSVVGFVAGLPDKAVSANEAKGGFSVKVTGKLADFGEPDRPCDNVTVVGECVLSPALTPATVVPTRDER